jgi:AraC-like DNA-binding protein
MKETIDPNWWPARELQRRPVSRVFICGNHINPPVYSHMVNFTRIEIPLRGCYKNHIEVGDKIQVVSLGAGSALFAPPNSWNLPEWQPGLKLLKLQFGRTQIGISLISSQSGNYPDLKTQKKTVAVPVTGPIPHLLNALLETHNEAHAQETFVLIIRSILRCLEGLLRKPLLTTVSRATTLLEEIRAFLQSNYQYEITRDTVARQFNITPNHLSRLFRSHGKITFNSYLTQVRVERAKYLLCSYKFKLDDIAARCGYHDTPYFCHVFKRLTNCTPVEYRLKKRQANA